MAAVAFTVFSSAELLAVATAAVAGIGSLLFLRNREMSEPSTPSSDSKSKKSGCPHDWNSNPRDFDYLCRLLKVDRIKAGKNIHKSKGKIENNPNVYICSLCGAISPTRSDNDIIGSLK
jgi:hypothetical protein